MDQDPHIVAPGQRILLEDDIKGDDGTFTLRGSVYSSFLGTVNSGPKVSVRPLKNPSNGKLGVLSPGDVVLGRITSTTLKVANVDILSAGELVFGEPLKGQLRLDDIREFEKDSIRMADCFRSGDVIRAVTLHLGASQQYFLSTSSNELGVIIAKSLSGHSMVPKSWNEMLCPITQALESRKVAKV